MNVTTLVQPTTFAGLSPRVEAEIERAYWSFDERRKRKPMARSERDAFKDAMREAFLRLRDADTTSAQLEPVRKYTRLDGEGGDLG